MCKIHEEKLSNESDAIKKKTLIKLFQCERATTHFGFGLLESSIDPPSQAFVINKKQKNVHITAIN